tara:strand:+ start:1086 stop:1490 length:405 start_codon:yes stop_codon:yes gene_type:complete
MAVQVIRKAYFNSAHRLYNPTWDDEKNLEVFGKCAYPNYHGHNYVLEVKISGPLDEKTGMVVNLKRVEELIQEYVMEKLDHKNLNLDVPELKDKIPTAENIAILIYEFIQPHFPEFDVQIVLHETRKNIVVYPV